MVVKPKVSAFQNCAQRYMRHNIVRDIALATKLVILWTGISVYTSIVIPYMSWKHLILYYDDDGVWCRKPHLIQKLSQECQAHVLVTCDTCVLVCIQFWCCREACPILPSWKFDSGQASQEGYDLDRTYCCRFCKESFSMSTRPKPKTKSGLCKKRGRQMRPINKMMSTAIFKSGAPAKQVQEILLKPVSSAQVKQDWPKWLTESKK